MKNMPVTKTVFQKAFYIGVLAAFGVLVAFSAFSFDASHSVVARVAHAETVSNDTSDTASVVISHVDNESHEEISSPVDNSSQHSDSDKDKKDEKKDKDSDHSHDGENGGGHDGDHNGDDDHCYGDDSHNSDSSNCGGGDHKPSVTLTANPQIIHLGDSSTLTWDSKNTKYCSANWTTSVAVSGTQTVSPTETKTYYITCTGNPADSVTTSVTVTVIKDGGQCTAPVFTSVLTASGKVGVAFSYTLSATSTGSSTSITYKVGTSTLPAGLTFVPNTISGIPTVSGVFNVPLRATNQCGVDEKTLVLTVSPADNGGGNGPTAILTATPASITAGATSTLSWISSNTTSCYAPWTSATSTSGSFVVSPATTTAYTIICSNTTQSATSTATVTVTTDNGGGGGNAPTVTLSALPTSITAGATSTLSWVSTNTTSCVAPWTTATSTTGSFVVSPATTTAYTIVCSNNSQSATSTATVTVTTDNGGGGGNGPAVTLTANPTTVTVGQGSTLSWTSTNTTSCVAPWTTATSTSGSELVSPTVTTDYTIACSNGSQTATTTATVTVSTGNGGGGGGGGSSGGSSGGGGGRSGSRHYVTGGVPSILGAATSCSYLEDYLHIGWTNNPKEVIKLQVFLSALEGFKNLKISGTFDQQTFDAVSTFQTRYKADILTPWGHTEPTGYVYILTKKKVNEIYCNQAFPVNAQQAKEISDFKALMQGLTDRGIAIPGITSAGTQGQGKGQILATNTSVPVNFSGALANTIKVAGSKTLTVKDTKGNTSEKGILRSGIFSNPNWRQVAAAVFAGPRDFKQSSKAVIVFIVLLAAIYAAARFIVDSQNKDGALTVESLRLRKIFFFVLGLLGAVLGSLLFRRYTLVLPLLSLVVLLSVVALWLSLKKKEVRTLVEIKD